MNAVTANAVFWYMAAFFALIHAWSTDHFLQVL
jgi:hypothetical protein